MRDFFADYGLYFAWIIAIIATGGSLYFSEVKLFVPCTLCWYQRILMYPFVLTLAIASFKQDKGIIKYALPIAVLGSFVAIYHLLEQNLPGFGAPALCKLGIPCSTKYIGLFGIEFLSIPALSLIAFLLIIFLLIMSSLQNK